MDISGMLGSGVTQTTKIHENFRIKQRGKHGRPNKAYLYLKILVTRKSVLFCYTLNRDCMCSPSLRVLFADDHPLFRAGFKHLLENSNLSNLIVLEASNGAELIEKAERENPDIIITDIAMPFIDGIEATRLIVAKNPSARIIALSALDDLSTTYRMCKAGAVGFLSKYSSEESILESIVAVISGNHFFEEKLRERLFDPKVQINKKQKFIELSKQELKVIRCVCEEMSNKEIAQALKLKVRTIEDYKSKLAEKMGARNAVGIALYALLNNLVSTDELRKEKNYSTIPSIKNEWNHHKKSMRSMAD
jgi:DNA-binding NarL/FixJ family response regulator